MLLQNLAKIRKQKGLTQEALAQKAGISFHTLVKIESGRITNPRIETVMKLAKVLEVKVDDLIRG